MPPSKPISPRQSRAIGALLGVHAGDSLGASLEFFTHSQIRARHPNGLREIIGGGTFNWPAGHATDDTDMTRGVLLAYRDAREAKKTQKNHDAEVDVARLAGDYFLAWEDGNWPDRKKGSMPLDMGGATSQGLLKYRASRDPEKAGAGTGSAGNGSLMRCIPTGLFQFDLEKVTQDSVRISMVTHNDARCTISCAAYNHMVAALVDGASVEYAIRAGEAVAVRMERGRKGEVYAAIRLGRELQLSVMAERGPPVEMKGGCSGYVLESLTVAVMALRDRRSLEDALVDVVRIGRDTDTNAAIAGGLLGARDGEEAIPVRWREMLQFGEEFREIALELTR